MKRIWKHALKKCAVMLIPGVGLVSTGIASVEGPQEVLSNASMEMLANAAQSFTGNGTWWNPAESGTGFFFEAQNDIGVVTFFVYEANGRAVWYSGAGTFTTQGTGKYAFSGTLQRYAGGQSATSLTPKTPTSAVVGSVQIAFDGDTAQIQLPGRTYSAQKFNATGVGSPATASQPETGIYWNATESGRGYTIEVNNNLASIGVFHYAPNGEPTWNLVVSDIASGKLVSEFTAYAGGQTLAGPYTAPTKVPTTEQFSALFSAACEGQLQLPGMPSVPVKRFAFGGLAAGAECRYKTSVGAPAPAPAPVSFSNVSWRIFSPAVLKAEIVEYNTQNLDFIAGPSAPISTREHTFAEVSDTTGNPKLFGSTLTGLGGAPGFRVQVHVRGMPTGKYAGVAAVRFCYRANLYGKSFCDWDYPNTPVYLPYEILVKEMTTTWVPAKWGRAIAMKPETQQAIAGWVRGDGYVTSKNPVLQSETPYFPKFEVSAPFTKISFAKDNFDGYSVWVDVPPNTPKGRLSGTVIATICRDDPVVCASPHKGSPFTFPFSIEVAD